MKRILLVALCATLAAPVFATTITPPTEADCKGVNDSTLAFATNPAMVSNQQKAADIAQLIQGGRGSGVSECLIMQQVKAASIQ